MQFVMSKTENQNHLLQGEMLELIREVISTRSTSVFLNSKICPHMFLSDFVKREEDCQILIQEMYSMTGLYVLFGSKIFKKKENISMKVESNFISYLLLKYQIAKRKTVSAFKMSVSEVVSHLPFMVAEHLHRGRGNIPTLIDKLPRCLAFEGGLSLIPEDDEWEPMTVLFKVWISSLNTKETRALCDFQYQNITYTFRNNQLKHLLMRHFNIIPPPVDYVLQTIEEILDDQGLDELLEIYRTENFEKAFPHFTVCIREFHSRHRAISSPLSKRLKPSRTEDPLTL